MKTIKIALVSLVVLLGLSVASYAYDIVQVTNTPEADETEYSIAIFGNTVYAVWVSGNEELYFDKSVDLGKTWGLNRKIIAPYSNGGKILVDKFGNLFILCRDDYNYAMILLNSIDGGESFIELGKFDIENAIGLDFAIDEIGQTIYIAKVKYMGGYICKIYICKSLDGGVTFSEWREIFTVWNAREIQVETSKDGKEVYVFLTYTVIGGYHPNIYFTKSLDYGERFSELISVFAGPSERWYEEYIDSAVDASGKIYLNWTFQPHDWTWTDHKIYLSESSDGGENFSTSSISDYYSWYYPPREGRPYSSSISVDGAGNVYCAFYKQKNNYFWGLYFDKRIGTEKFNIDQYLDVSIQYFSSKPMVAVTPDDKTAFIMWNNSDTSDGNHDLYSVTFPINRPPILNPIGNKEVNEGDLLEFTVSATDSDDDVLTYSAGSSWGGTSLPYGATFDSETRVFSWRPEYFMAAPSGSSSYEIRFTVSDGLHIDEEVITITVYNTNRSPVITPIGNKSVNEGNLLQFTVQAQDPDYDTITYSMLNAPQGATIDSQTGIFNWIPDYTQAGSYIVTFVASDGNASSGETITITVNNVNRPPVLNPIGNKTVSEGKLLQFTLSTTDPDNDPITYSANNLPKGATIDSKTGQFKWTPDYTQARNYVVTFIASDGALSDKEDVTIKVNNVPIPDLRAEAITYTVSGTRFYRFRAPIKNIGDKTITTLFYVYFYVDGVKKGSTPIGYLGAGKTTTLYFYWTATKGTHAIKVVADATNKIKEANENNNTSTVQISVR